ncbi:MAG: hypothetical protein R3358_08530, partial [Woeseiaceae bacterium]|nr:hypothetical protein [Woeseiaceae bacterium]
RRIIDAAIGERGFYQFDDMIHVPEGSWLNWPWAYDYLLALALRVALFVRPDMQPMQFLAYVPVLWVFVNTGLMTLIARSAGLGPVATAIGLLVFSLSPLTQNLHGLGLIDHHFIELSFVLATVLAGQRFFAQPGGPAAIALGVLLGVAVGFHNGLFILQLPVLAAVLLLWLRGAGLPRPSLQALAASLAGATLLVLLPSAPFRDLQFEFWTLSWFHLYVAFGSAVVLTFVGWRSCSAKNLAVLAVIGALMIAPLLAKLVTGAAFVSGSLDIIGEITEVESPLARLGKPGGLGYVTMLYGWLFFAAPLVFVHQAWRLYRERDAASVFFAIMSLFGIALMLSQYRLHPFGFWALIIGGLLGIEAAMRRFELSRLVTTVVTLAIVAVAIQPPLRNQLFARVPPGLDRDYAASVAIFPSLATACTRRPGAVLSYRDDGHPIRYHSDCSVVTNNFLITPLHRRKVAESNRYLSMTPQQLVEAAPHIRYVFVRMLDIYEMRPGHVRPRTPDEIKRFNAPLFNALTFGDAIPPEFRLIDELRIDDGRDFAYVRIFEIVRN